MGHVLEAEAEVVLVCSGVAAAAAASLAKAGVVIETPKLLLMSAGENAPAGVANGSGEVGRN